MENEIKVGDYVRINEDFRIVCIGIGKVARISADGKEIYVDKCTNSLPISVKKEQIVRHSTNLIDIIECGDYVNGYCVAKIEKDENDKITDICYEEEMEMQLYSVGDIESIVTKEQFEAISYKVERKD